MSSLEGRVAIVTGGAGGIGTSIAKAYSDAGASVVVASRKKENLDSLVVDIEIAGGEALAVVADVTQPDQVENMINQAVARFGRLDILVNNAGGALHMKQPHELTTDQWDAGITLNLNSVFYCSLAASKVMIPQHSGKIINISSVAGLKDTPGFVHYGAAKAGVVDLSRSLAAGWARYNITVNCIAPGLTATPGILKSGMMPSDKAKDGTTLPPLHVPPGPEHAAELALFLASSAADRLTGEVIPIRAMVASDR